MSYLSSIPDLNKAHAWLVFGVRDLDKVQKGKDLSAEESAILRTKKDRIKNILQALKREGRISTTPSKK